VNPIIEPILFLWNIIFTFYYTRVRPQCDYSILGRDALLMEEGMEAEEWRETRESHASCLIEASILWCFIDGRGTGNRGVAGDISLSHISSLIEAWHLWMSRAVYDEVLMEEQPAVEEWRYRHVNEVVYRHMLGGGGPAWMRRVIYGWVMLHMMKDLWMGHWK